MKASAKLEGLDKANRRLNAISDGRSLLRTLQLAAVAEAKRRVPRKTGNLGRSIGPGGIGPDHAIIQARARYAGHVEFGTKPHVIRPKSKRVLAWPAEASGRRLSGRARSGARMAFARAVRHPGTKAQPFMLPAARWALEKFGISKVIERWNRAA